jgi:hypothetical protein
MAGTPGRSGGKRPGAGPKVKTRTLRTGQQLLCHEMTADNTPVGIGDLVTVEIVSRTKIILRHDDGSTTVLGY